MKQRYKGLKDWERELLSYITYKTEEDKTYTVSELLNEGYLIEEVLPNLFIELDEERQEEQSDILLEWYETQKEEQK